MSEALGELKVLRSLVGLSHVLRLLVLELGCLLLLLLDLPLVV